MKTSFTSNVFTSQPDFTFKVLLVGDSGVGKSCILQRFLDHTFEKHFINTIGVDFRFRNMKVYNKHIKLQIWDTAGQEKFHAITCAYFRKAHGVILVFDITNPASLVSVCQRWLPLIQNHADYKEIAIVLAGNKSDLVQNANDYTTQMETFNEMYDQEQGYTISNAYEISACTGENIEVMFSFLAQKLVDRYAEHTNTARLRSLSLANASSEIDTTTRTMTSKSSILSPQCAYSINDQISSQKEENQASVLNNCRRHNVIVLDTSRYETEKCTICDFSTTSLTTTTTTTTTTTNTVSKKCSGLSSFC